MTAVCLQAALLFVSGCAPFGCAGVPLGEGCGDPLKGSAGGRYDAQSLSADNQTIQNLFYLDSATTSHMKFVFSPYCLRCCWYTWYSVYLLHRAVDSACGRYVLFCVVN